MAVQDTVRVYGVEKGAAGVRVIERAGVNAMDDPRYGTTFMVGLLKRAPMGIPIPYNTYAEYQDSCGDPRDSNWHLFADGSHLMPDAIAGYYQTGGGSGQLWLIRLEMPNAKPSEIMLKNSLGGDALRIKSANPGRWGGQFAKLTKRPIIYATANTFTLFCPGVFANQFIGAEVEFTNDTGKRYPIVGNTASFPSGEVVFMISPQFSLILDGVTGPTTLTGTATYNRYRPLTGTATYTQTRAITGTATAAGRVVTGSGTLFDTEAYVGGALYLNDEVRTIDSITSNTTLTVAEGYTTDGTGNFQVDNFRVDGTGTLFTTELTLGESIFVTIDGERQSRVVRAITSPTSLTLASGFTEDVSTVAIEVNNLNLVGIGTLFTTELQDGISYIVDPSRSGEAVRVIDAVSPTSLRLEKPFAHNFTLAQLTKQSLAGAVELAQVGNEGLSVEVGQGTKFPATHFSLNVRFNGSLVYQVSDASLDANDRYYIEPLINDDGKNICYRTGTLNYQRWITVENMWAATYTTAAGADVRPNNGSGKVLGVDERRLYTISEMDYASALNNLIYPDPYASPRSYLRITAIKKPVALQGEFSTLGVVVNGSQSNFRSVFKPGDYIYDLNTKSIRKIRAVISDIQMNLETGFQNPATGLPYNVPAGTLGIKAGYFEVGRGYDLRLLTQTGKNFLVSFPQILTGGYDGNLAGLIPYSWTRYADVDENVIENALWGKDLGLVKLACPGISDVVVQKAYANYAMNTAYMFRGEIPSNYNSASTAEVFLNQYLGRNDFQVLAFPSYGFVSSPFGGGTRLVSISGDILGGEASYAGLSQGYHKPFAGVNAILPRVLKLPYEIKSRDEAVINITGIQPIKMMYGNCVVFGARSTAISPTYDFKHIREIQCNYIRQFLESRELLEQIFKPNQPYTLETVVMVLNNWARKEYKKGVFTQYLSFRQAVDIQGDNLGSGVITDQASAVGLVDIINGKLRIYVSYIPTGIVEELSINLGPDILTSQYGNALSGSLV